MKKALASILAAVLSLSLLAACGDSGSSSAAGGGTSEAGETNLAPDVNIDELENGTMRVLYSEEPSSGDTFVAVLDKWAEETGNTIELVVIPYDDQPTKFPQMALAGDVPDLIVTTRLGRQYPEDFYDLSEIVDMSIFNTQAAEVIGKQRDPDYEQYGAYVMLPYQFTITNVFYNADAFEAANLTPPTVEEPWTLEEFEEAARALVASGSVNYGMAMDFSRARYDNMMYMFDGSATKETEPGVFAVNSNSEENIAALTKFVEWNDESLMPKHIWAGGGSDNPYDYFVNGDVGIYFSGSWNYASLENDATFEWGVMPSPVGPNGDRSAIIGGTGLGVATAAERDDLAIAFIKWFFEDPANYEYYLSLEKGMSSLNDVTYTPSDEKVAADFAVMQAEAQNIHANYLVDDSSNWLGHMDAEYREALSLAVNGDGTPEAILDQFAKDLSAKSGWEMTNPK